MKKNALIRYTLIIVGTLLSFISIFICNNYTNGGGYGGDAKLLMVNTPILAIIVIICNEVLIVYKHQKNHYLSHLPNLILIFLLGANPIANLITYPQGLLHDLFGAFAFILWLALLINNIIIDIKEKNTNSLEVK